MGLPAGRHGDQALCVHVCKECANIAPHPPHPSQGPIVSTSCVKIEGRPAARVGDQGSHATGPCCGPNTWVAFQGSACCFIEGKPAFRKGDPSHHCGAVGRLIEGSSCVFIG
jgi:uncharacterized Zn-binding protein involved in type VI secretion